MRTICSNAIILKKTITMSKIKEKKRKRIKSTMQCAVKEKTNGEMTG